MGRLLRLIDDTASPGVLTHPGACRIVVPVSTREVGMSERCSMTITELIESLYTARDKYGDVRLRAYNHCRKCDPEEMYVTTSYFAESANGGQLVLGFTFEDDD
jgi:hypothetical protein